MGQQAHEIPSEPSPAPAVERGARSGPILLAIHGLAEPSGALRRAAELTRAVGTFLAVLRVRDDHRHAAGVVVDETSRASSNDEIAERTTDWMVSELGEGARKHRVLLSHHGFDSEVVHTARMMGASLVVLAGDGEQRAAHATYLALRANVPVLIARAPHQGGAIVAATDLDTSDFPVLRRAAELARRMHAPAVFVHNVAEPPAPAAASTRDTDQARHARLADAGLMLARLRAELAPEATTVVSEVATPSDAVLGIARDLDADLIVVGARQRSWLGRALGGLMAERTAWRAPRSVLIVPMPVGRDERIV